MVTKEEQFKKLVDDNKVRIMRICRYYAPSVDDQKDIYQEILINIWKSLDSFRGEAAIGTWIYRIAVNTSLSFAGKQYKMMKLNVDLESIEARNLLADDVREKEIKEEQYQTLQVLLNQLSVIDKAIMGLVLEDLSYREIADIIGITEPNIRVKVHRIKENLRQYINGGKDENE